MSFWNNCISKEKHFQVLNFKVVIVMKFYFEIAEKCKFRNLIAFSKSHFSHFIVLYALLISELKHTTKLYRRIYNSCAILDSEIVKKIRKISIFLIPFWRDSHYITFFYYIWVNHFKYNNPLWAKLADFKRSFIGINEFL